jgi:hypothetical protein
LARFQARDPLQLAGMKVSSASTIPRSLLAPLSTARRKRWRQRKAVLIAIPQRSAEVFTVSPSDKHSPNVSHISLRCRPDNGVPVRAPKVFPQPLQRWRFSPRAIGHRPGRAAARAASIFAHSQFDCRQRRFTDRPARQNLHGLCFLTQAVNHAQPSLKSLPVHRPYPQRFRHSATHQHGLRIEPSAKSSSWALPVSASLAL